MLIQLGYDIEFEFAAPTTTVAVLHVHPSRKADLVEKDEVRITPHAETSDYLDSFGNLCTRFVAPQGTVRLRNSTLIWDSGRPDEVGTFARQHAVDELPTAVLRFLLASRYCEVDRLSEIAWSLFGNYPKGWPLVQAICDWVHNNVTFGYQFARPTKTAVDVWNERNGVCRDFQHLALTMCRCMNIPARYVTGYLGDIGVPPMDAPMDFSAWFEVYLGGRWWTCDARFNVPRIGRVLMATGQDAADVAITTSFGSSALKKFQVFTDEVKEATHSAGSAASFAD